MTSRDQQKKLVERLATLTQENRLEWKSDRDGEPFSTLGTYFVNLKESRDASGSTLYKIIIENSNQETIEEFNDEDLDDTSGGKYYQLMKTVLTSARRQAKGADKALDDILKRLDEI